MARTPQTDPIDDIAADVLRSAFLFDQPAIYRQGVLDALAAVRDAVTAHKSERVAGPSRRAA